MFFLARAVPFIILIFSHSALHAEESGVAKDGADVEKPVELRKPISKKGTLMIDGKEIKYTSTAGKLLTSDGEGKVEAPVFYVSYVRDGVSEQRDRPVMFAFNGGPGSSSVWLHLGLLGPKRVSLPGDGTVPPTPPVQLVENEYSLLDVCDLVFIDPVSTGYSRAGKKEDEKKFHGIEADIESVGDFIRKWVTVNKRWDSRKFLCGESYGGIRAAGLAEHLQDRYGMSLNGVVLLSSLLDFRTLLPAQGSQLSHQVFLPAYTAAAHYHQKFQGDLESLLGQSRAFAFGDYALALLKGNSIGDEELSATAENLAKFTSLPADLWKRKMLRIEPSEFRAELLRKEGKVIGRFDSRVAWDATDGELDYANYDPSYSLAYGAFSTAMLGYLGEDLGWEEDEFYEILTSDVNPWKYGSDNRVVNFTDRLVGAIRENPKLRVLVMGAYADLATPPDGVPYSIRQAMDFPAALRDRVTYTHYQAGHMFYLNPPDLIKARKDLVDFVTGVDGVSVAQ